jgi:excinuclease UvrABC ATPase subunit
MGVEINEDTCAHFAPVVVGRKGEYYQLLYDLLGKGFERAKIDGKLVSCASGHPLQIQKARHRCARR